MSVKILPFPGAVAPAVAPLEPAPPMPEAQQAEPPRPKRRTKDPVTPVPLRRAPRALTEAEQTLQKRMLDAYFNGHRRAKGHAASGIERDRGFVEDFLAYVGHPVWDLSAIDFEAWTSYAAITRHLAPGSQRVMQASVACFFKYLIDTPGWQQDAHTKFNGRIERVVNETNRVIHTTDRANVRPRRYLTSEELDRVFRAFDVIIADHAQRDSSDLRLYQRDKCLFYTYYAYALRLAEGQGLNVSSFWPNPDIPELGNFGTVGVYGKGASGSGPRLRHVPAINPEVREVLDWYLSEVRPKFPIRTKDAEDAFWLSRNGKRMSRASISNRLKCVIKAVGLDPRLFSPHGLRHMAASHSATANVPLSFTQARLGHAFGSTTQLYTHLGDDYSRLVATNLVRAALVSATKDKP